MKYLGARSWNTRILPRIVMLVFAEPLTVADQEVLDRALVKLVLLGKQVGVDPDRMIELLDSGLTVGELLIYLAVCNDRQA